MTWDAAQARLDDERVIAIDASPGGTDVDARDTVVTQEDE
jgi:hypothetical protein